MAQELSLNIQKLSTSMEERMKAKFNGDGSAATAPTINKVPSSLRKGADDAYNPKLISIGPLHHQSFKGMENTKWKYLQALIARDPASNKLEKYVAAVWNVEAEARRMYSVEIELEVREFVEMLVLDGCFLVEFLIKRAQGSVGSPWNQARWSLPMLRNDLLLLENQIPFFVLKELYDKTSVTFPNGTSLDLFDLALHYVSKEKVKKEDLEVDQKKVHHLLHLDYLCKLKNFTGKETTYLSSVGGWWHGAMRGVSGLVSSVLFYLLSVVLMCKCPRRRSGKGRRPPRMIHTATNLKEAGIKFKRKEQDEGRECYLNVSFTEDGTLLIPSLSLQQTTISSFRNLIAFEQCCPDIKDPCFTAYAVFMDKIIDTPADVTILVKKKIIESKLGTDEDVATLFNNVCNGATLNYDKHYLADLFLKVSAYCESDQNRWRAALIHKFFYSPWAVVSFIAAIFLILLTIVGTGATIWQTLATIRG